ncbi:MAG: HEAT repeat domain-containing protein [Acidobacteriales bacterium]|nr:HEAT repeat domain-containing protein [Terriglobales bacterium]
MKCEWVRENILLHIYNELPDDARYELEQHLGRCSSCTAELKAARKLHATLSEVVAEPSPSLVAASRLRLQEALETAEQSGFWRRLIFEPVAWLQQMRFSPALSAVLLIAGFAAGVGTTYQMMGNANRTAASAQSNPQNQYQESSVAGIRSITQDPSSNQISIKYDTVSTQQAQGSMNDQRIQQLLLFAARNNYNSGVRMDSVDLLIQKPNDSNVREALIYALRYDTNPGVRLKALDGLGPYVKEDVRVRDAVLEALMDDSNPGLRTQAMHLLETVRADSSVRAVLQKLAQSDQNAYIRSQARTQLAQLPEID